MSDKYAQDQRNVYGARNSLVNRIRIRDNTAFFDIFRMSPEVFDYLLSIVGPHLKKEYVVREPISEKARLELTIRYLASGDLQQSIALLFRVSPPSICSIVAETVEVIWKCLKPLVFKTPNDAMWRKISDRFQKKLQFPRCIGCIDGKLVTMVVSFHLIGHVIYSF